MISFCGRPPSSPRNRGLLAGAPLTLTNIRHLPVSAGFSERDVFVGLSLSKWCGLSSGFPLNPTTATETIGSVDIVPKDNVAAFNPFVHAASTEVRSVHAF